MKKIFSLLMIVALTVTVLVSCGTHTHRFLTDWSSDETHHWHDCKTKSCDEKADYAEHSFESFVSIDNTKHKKTCECGYEVTEDHTFGDWTDAGNGQHKKTCECGYEVTEAHAYGDWTDAGNGKHKKTCECGALISETHAYGDWTDAGNGKHEKSCECGNKMTADHEFGDWSSISETQHKKTCECGAEVTDGHTWGEGEITTPATPDTPGVETFTCTDCGKTKTEPIEFGHEHVYGDWTSISDTQHKKTCECGAEVVGNHELGDWTSASDTQHKKSCAA